MVMDMEFLPQIPNVDADTIHQARLALESGMVAQNELALTLVYALLDPLSALIPLAAAWNDPQNFRVAEMRQNLQQSQIYVREIVKSVDRSVVLAREKKVTELLQVMANDIKSRIILIYSGAELMVDEDPDTLHRVEVEQLLTFMVRGLHRTLLYVNKVISLKPDIALEGLHPWRK